MTEITELIDRKSKNRKRVPVHAFSFGAALIFAPVLVAIFGVATPALIALLLGLDGPVLNALYFVAAVSFFSVPFGAATYLTFGATAFWYALRRGVRAASAFAAIGVFANLVSAPVVLAYMLLTDQRDPMGMMTLIVGFGVIFAGLWGAVFASLYKVFSGSHAGGQT